MRKALRNGMPALYGVLAGSLLGQTPTISDITVNSVSHSSVNIQFRNSAPAWVALKYGLSSGNYIYTSDSYQANANFNDSNNVDASISLGGLAPSTTYYILPTARPNQDNDTGICATVACGAIEQVFTTAPLPAIHPSPPAPPNAWTPSEPDTSAYIIVPMQNAGNGECVASSNVPAGKGWKSAVTAGDNITTILSKIFFGTVIEFPQGIVCKVYQTDPNWHTGYQLPALALDSAANGNIDSPAHRWIVFRTKARNPADFPPFGVRTGPQFAAKLAKLVVQTPAMSNDPTKPGLGVQNFNGQLFDCYVQGCHHFWFENMEWTHLADSTVYPPGLPDPAAFGAYFRLFPNLSDITTPSTTPAYNVLDRIYAHGQPWPSREVALFVPGGNHWAILSCWAQANTWFPGVFPTVNPTMNGPVISVPNAYYQFNAFDKTPIGSTGSATATFTVPAGYSGAFLAWIDSGGLTIDYQTGPGVSMICSGCNARSETLPARSSVPITSLWFFTGHFSNGNAVLDASMPWYTIPTVLSSARPIGIYDYPGNFAVFDNNFITASGQTVYNDADGSRTDAVWTHNYFYLPRSKMQHASQWDGYGYSFRNVFETKQALRWRIDGNIFDGAAAGFNPGNAIYIAGSYLAAYSNGTQDVKISNNLLRHIPSGFQCSGGGAQQPPDSPQAERIEVFNNLWIDLNRDAYNNGGGGLFSGPFSSYPGCEDLNIHRNTVDLTLGVGPALFLTGSASNGTTVMGEGLNVSDNEMHLSLNALDALTAICGQVVPSHPAVPATACVGGTTSAAYRQMLDSSYMHAGATVTGSWNFTNNVIVGALTARGRSTWTDIDQATLNIVAAAFPPGNIFPTGPTMAARRAAVNWDPVTYRIIPSSWNPGNIGADVDAVASATGKVTGISVKPLARGATLTYTAPDTRACYADAIARNGAATRLSDSGGAVRQRSITFGGLEPETSYTYRLMCYFDQAAQYEFRPDEITSGAFRTEKTDAPHD